MRRKFSLILSSFIVLLLTLLTTSSTSVFAAYCANPQSGTVTASIKSDTLSTVSGTELPLRILLTNTGDKAFNDGSVIITISRESKVGDFSKDNNFLLTRAVVKTGVNLPPHSDVKLSFAWKIPANAPSGLYVADAGFSQNGQVFDNTPNPITNNSPFGNRAKIFVSGEATGAIYFVSGARGDNSPKIVLVNGTNKDIKLPVVLKTYDGGIDDKVFHSEFRNIFITKGASTAINYSIPNNPKIYSVTAEGTYKDFPVFYMYTNNGVSGCLYKNTSLPWTNMTVVALLVLFLAVYLKRRDNHTQ